MKIDEILDAFVEKYGKENFLFIGYNFGKIYVELKSNDSLGDCELPETFMGYGVRINV